MALTAEPNVDLSKLDARFRAALEDFAERCDRHRYSLPIHITSGFREGDPGAHGYGQAVDIRGWGDRWKPLTDHLRAAQTWRRGLSQVEAWERARELRYIQLACWISAMWAATCRDHGYAPDQWGIGVYPLGDRHIHLDVRPHVTPVLYAAVWVGHDDA